MRLRSRNWRSLVPAAWAITLGVMVYDFGAVARWDGQFPLWVKLTAPSDRKIVKVFARIVPVYVWPGVREALATDPGINPRSLGLEDDAVSWVEGRPFTISVWCSGRVSNLGRELSYSQERHLVIRVEFDDLERENFMVNVPDGRSVRSVSVSIP